MRGFENLVRARETRLAYDVHMYWLRGGPWRGGRMQWKIAANERSATHMKTRSRPWNGEFVICQVRTPNHTQCAYAISQARDKARVPGDNRSGRERDLRTETKCTRMCNVECVPVRFLCTFRAAIIRDANSIVSVSWYSVVPDVFPVALRVDQIAQCTSYQVHLIHNYFDIVRCHHHYSLAAHHSTLSHFLMICFPLLHMISPWGLDLGYPSSLNTKSYPCDLSSTLS